MSSTLDRLRKLHGVRPKKRTRAEPEIPKSRPSNQQNEEIVYVDLAETRQAREQNLASHHAFNYCAALEEVVPGQEIENESGVCYLVTKAYPLSTRRGPNPLENLLVEDPQLFDTLYPKFNLSTSTSFRKAAFIDTETTGLGIGAGVYCFMIGVGTFEHLAAADAAGDENDDVVDADPVANLDDQPTHFVVRQFFMRSPDEETALLVAVADALRGCDMTVTFNGRTFDLPMMRARYRQNRYALPPAYEESPLLAESQPHLDLLLPARRLWKRRLGSCRLINLEHKILEQTRTEADVPGHLIPLLYTEYARSGEAGAIPGIFYHNCEDIVSMVGLAERLCRAFVAQPSQADSLQTGKGPASKSSASNPREKVERKKPTARLDANNNQTGKDDELHGLEWLSLGDAHERVGDVEQAEVAFQHSIHLLSVEQSGQHTIYRADAYRRLGQLQKRQGRWVEAIETWQLWLSSVPSVDPTPYIELAKYFEWQSRDLEQAEMWTSWALHNLQSASGQSTFRGQIPDIEHRLTRIQRKKRS